MEKLSATTAMIGLLAVGGKTIEALWELNSVLRKSTVIITRTLQEVKQCRSSVHILYKVLVSWESSRLPLPQRGAWIEIDDLVVTLTDTVLAFSDIQGVCDEMDDVLIATSDFEAIVKQYDQKLTNLCARLRWHNLSMTMMMTILRCPDSMDAQNSKASLGSRVQRLLLSNADLASRMRLLDNLLETRTDILEILLTSASSTDPSGRSGGRTQTPTSQQKAHWSVFSGYSLADLPVLSSIPLPVDIVEVRDGAQFYTVDYSRRISQDLDELMRNEAGRGTSKTLGFILGKPIRNIDQVAAERNQPVTTTVIVPTNTSTKKKGRRWR